MSGVRILFITSNGTGLGHLTRSLAIARRLPESAEALFITLSAAAPVVEELGYPVEYIASYGTPAAGNDWRWSRRLRARLGEAIAEADPAAIVFDGTHPYEPLLGALRGAPRARAVWCRRPLWKSGSSRAPLGRSGSFDAILEPGELAAELDRGPTVARRDEVHGVAPIVLLDREELLSRPEAERELGLEPGAEANLLVALGQGEEVREATDRCLRRLANRGDFQVAALSSTLAGLESVPEGVVHLEATYPMSRYYAAFDGAVAAAGYNAFHELIALGVPSLFVPMHRETDDQPARARFAESSQAGLAVDGPADPRLEAQLERLCDRSERERIRAGIAGLSLANGAAEAAGWLTELATGAGPVAGVDSRATSSRARTFARRWGQFVRHAPRTALRLGRQTLTMARPRTLVLALGLEGEELANGVADALGRTPDPPARVLVVTDSLELAPLRALGVGVEHVPGPAGRQVELAGTDYEAFARRRLELILAERPRPRLVLRAPGSAPVAAALSAATT